MLRNWVQEPDINAVKGFFFSHAVNLLNNLPVPCLDVLIDVPVQGGQEKYGGKNMDAIQKLLDFMEKRIDKVKPKLAAACRIVDGL